MVRPRNKKIEISAETQAKRLREQFSRRQLIRMFGVGGATAIAGCGGGGDAGQEETPTGGGQQMETDTETSSETPTSTEVVETPTGKVTVTDHWFRDITGTNFEKFEPNPWNLETGFVPPYHTMWLSRIPWPRSSGSTVESALKVIMMLAARKFELDPDTNILTMHLRDDLTYSDGAEFNVDAVQGHFDLVKGQLEAGEKRGDQSETTLPLSLEKIDEYTLDAQLAPGNAVLRMITAIFEGQFRTVSRTHPKFHGKFIEEFRDAQTTNEKTDILRRLTRAKFPKERLTKLSLGAFKATEWDPEKMVFTARKDFPWGLDYNPDQSRIFKGVRWVSVGEETQEVNAAIAGNASMIGLPNKQSFKRFPDNWKLYGPVQETIGTVLFFSKKSMAGKKTEKALGVRKAVAYLMDAQEAAKVNDLVPAYEQTTGFVKRSSFSKWIGDEEFSNWTNYGKKETGYLFEEKGYESLRKVGYERGKNGVWIHSETGEPLAPTVELSLNDMSKPVNNNVIEQLNRHGIEAEGKFQTWEAAQEDSQSFNFEWGVFSDNVMMTPHPFIGYREDVGLGSRNLPVAIASWDWHNGHRRVEVPMPVGDPDGELTTYDWDTNTMGMLEIDGAEKMKQRARELSWVANQWVPGVAIKTKTVFAAFNTDQVQVDESDLSVTVDPAPAKKTAIPAGFWQPPK